MRTWMTAVALALLACDPDGGGGGDEDDGFDCEAVAIRDAEGNADPCDVQACQACADECGVDCAILESFPPQYACEGASFTVTDFCPDWEPPAASATDD
ncbi:MAG: hypothetical protein H0V89_06225 [Deltaproteobacteria bacterium]|nr:hypothetical protein [Deltaproteobacteria bacterium]